ALSQTRLAVRRTDQLLRQRSRCDGNRSLRAVAGRKPTSAPPATAAYSLHVRVRTFAAFGDEAVDPRGDSGQRYRAKLDHGIGMVTTALPSKCGKGDTFKS